MDFIRQTQWDLSAQLNHLPDFQTGLEKVLKIFPSLVVKMDSRIIQDIFRQYPGIEETVIRERHSLAKEAIQFIQRGQSRGS